MQYRLLIWYISQKGDRSLLAAGRWRDTPNRLLDFVHRSQDEVHSLVLENEREGMTTFIPASLMQQCIVVEEVRNVDS